jgi:hypothetical protein
MQSPIESAQLLRLVGYGCTLLRDAQPAESRQSHPLIFRLLHFAGVTFRVFVRRKTRGKNYRSIPVVLVGFESQSLAVHLNPLLASAFYHYSPDPLIGLKI